MSEDKELQEGSRQLWRDLVRKAMAEECLPVAVIGATGTSRGYSAAVFRAHSLPRGALLIVLRQLVSQLEREEQGEGLESRTVRSPKSRTGQGQGAREEPAPTDEPQDEIIANCKRAGH